MSDTEKRLFQLSEAEKDAFLAGMASFDGQWELKVEIARALAKRAPEEAVAAHLEAISDEIMQAALAAELAHSPEVTGTLEGLYGLLLVLQEAPETLADLLEKLVADHPDNPLVTDIARAFHPSSQSASNGPLLERLQGVDLNTLNPMAAFSVVAELKAMVAGET